MSFDKEIQHQKSTYRDGGPEVDAKPSPPGFLCHGNSGYLALKTNDLQKCLFSFIVNIILNVHFPHLQDDLRVRIVVTPSVIVVTTFVIVVTTYNNRCLAGFLEVVTVSKIISFLSAARD